ncbi:major seminal plasma glycoprotein PSP-II-like [Budorcas taxicolor]|uniref:major seminal plasma glycoprotein PSP-II-like n=1 Tax=Budorcas taxicolor TaxID=37181 RepID=UPI00228441E3|nr:major seminal plasma glycoprotein PSP-II-like [Budorcas taxicolor]
MKLSSIIPWALLLSTATLVSTESDEDTRKCGGVHRNFSGRISSSFSWGPKCTWTILLKSGYTVVLTIPFLSLNCDEEDVEIIDGLPDSTTFGKFCSGGPLVFISSSNVMTVKYYRSSNQPVSPFDIFYYERPSVKFSIHSLVIMLTPKSGQVLPMKTTFLEDSSGIS